MHKAESIQGNDTQKILWNFEIKNDHFIRPRRREVELIICKKKIYLPDFAVSTYLKKKIKKIEGVDKYLDVTRELKNYKI